MINEVHISLKNDNQKKQDHELLDLIKACLKNDRFGQEKLYKRFYGLMMGIALRYFINKDDALDAVNHSFLKVFKNLGKFRFDGAFEGFISKICVRVILDKIRTQKWEERRESLEMEMPLPEGLLSNLYYQDLLQLLNHLPQNTKVVFNLFAIEGFKHHEIAKQLNISQGTSKWHVNAAKNQLKILIKEYHGK